MTLPVLATLIWFLPSGLLWAFVATLNFWIWRRSKSTGHVVMLVGAAWMALHYLLATFDVALLGATHYDLAVLLGSAVLTAGFYLSVRPLVAEEIGRWRRLVASKLGKPGVTPTIPYAPPAASAPVGTPAPAPAPTPGFPLPPPPPRNPPPPPRPTPSDDLTLR